MIKQRRLFPARRVLTTALAAMLVATVATVAPFSAGPAAAEERLAADDFSRRSGAGWGYSPDGQSYRGRTGDAGLTVREGQGFAVLPGAETAREITLPEIDARDVTVTSTVRSHTRSTGEQFVTYLLRHGPSGDLRVRFTLGGDGSVKVTLIARDEDGVERSTTEALVDGLIHTGQALRLEAQVVGQSPTTLAGRAWLVGEDKPARWQAQVSQYSGVTTQPGAVGLHFYAGRHTPDDATFSLDDLTVDTAGEASLPADPPAPPDPPVPPAPPTPPTPPADLDSATAGAPDLSTLRYPVPAGASFVSTSGSDSTGNGSTARPWRTVSHAVSSARSGSTIVIRGGTYHEEVEFPHGRAFTLQPYPGEEVWFDGSSAVTGWVADDGRWRKDGWTHLFDSSDYTGVMVDPQHPMAAHPDQVFIDGRALRQVSSLRQVGAGTFFVDRSAKRLWIGENPSGRSVRASTLSEALFVNRGNGSVIRGLGFRRYATPVRRMGAVKAYANGVTIENSIISDNAQAGLSLNGSGITVRDTSILRSGQLGIQADRTDNLVLTGNLVDESNTERFLIQHAAGGIKITSARPVELRRNLVSDSFGNGVWIDQSVKNATVIGNTFARNTRHALMFEVSGGLLFAGNTSVDNGQAGVRVLEAGNVQIYNNTFLDNRTGIDMVDGDRVAATAPSHYHDRRYQVPDPFITFEVENVDIRGNVVTAESGQRHMIGYDDARKRYSPSARRITTDYNAYWRARANSSQYFGAWGDWPERMRASFDFQGFREQSGQERHGVGRDGGTNPYVNASGLPTSAAPLGPPLPNDVADALGLPRGTSLRAGVPRATP